jgi:predicted transcriptional regulator
MWRSFSGLIEDKNGKIELTEKGKLFNEEVSRFFMD